MTTTLEWLIILTLPIIAIFVAWLVQLYDKHVQYRALMTRIHSCSLDSLESFLSNEGVFPRWNRRPIIVDGESCNGCKHCIEDCPTDAIELITMQGSNSSHFVPLFLDERCIQCGICIHSCPFNVIGIE